MKALLLALLVPAAAGAVTLVSVDEEIAIGRQADAEAHRRMDVLRDASVTRYVERVGAQLARSAPGPKYAYRFTVANYREINAFALPGGPVWIHRGLLQRAGTEGEVVAALAHEIAHVAQRHAASQLTNVMVANWGLGLLGAVLGNTGGAGPAQVAAGLMTGGVFLKFSRDDEREADRVGLAMMSRAGWDGRGMIDLLQRIRRESERNREAVALFVSTHPSPEDRIDRLQSEIGRRGGRRDSAAFRSVRARLERMPAAPALPAGR